MCPLLARIGAVLVETEHRGIDRQRAATWARRRLQEGGGYQFQWSRSPVLVPRRFSQVALLAVSEL